MKDIISFLQKWLSARSKSKDNVYWKERIEHDCQRDIFRGQSFASFVVFSCLLWLTILILTGYIEGAFTGMFFDGLKRRLRFRFFCSLFFRQFHSWFLSCSNTQLPGIHNPQTLRVVPHSAGKVAVWNATAVLSRKLPCDTSKPSIIYSANMRQFISSGALQAVALAMKMEMASWCQWYIVLKMHLITARAVMAITVCAARWAPCWYLFTVISQPTTPSQHTSWCVCQSVGLCGGAMVFTRVCVHPVSGESF